MVVIRFRFFPLWGSHPASLYRILYLCLSDIPSLIHPFAMYIIYVLQLHTNTQSGPRITHWWDILHLLVTVEASIVDFDASVAAVHGIAGGPVCCPTPSVQKVHFAVCRQTIGSPRGRSRQDRNGCRHLLEQASGYCEIRTARYSTIPYIHTDMH